jgi:hypothetical protein
VLPRTYYFVPGCHRKLVYCTGACQLVSGTLACNLQSACTLLQRGKQMVSKLNNVEREKAQLEWQLQQQDQTLTQLELTQRQLSEATLAYHQMHAQCVSLRAQAEDLAGHAAALQKVCTATLVHVSLSAALAKHLLRSY